MPSQLLDRSQFDSIPDTIKAFRKQTPSLQPLHMHLQSQKGVLTHGSAAEQEMASS